MCSNGSIVRFCHIFFMSDVLPLASRIALCGRADAPIRVGLRRVTAFFNGLLRKVFHGTILQRHDFAAVPIDNSPHAAFY
jgi:hypothetical protein